MSTSHEIGAGAAASGVRAGVDAKWWTLAAVCLGTFMLLLDITVVNVALPQIQGSLELSRGLQGVGGATMFSVSLALLADAFYDSEES